MATARKLNSRVSDIDEAGRSAVFIASSGGPIEVPDYERTGEVIEERIESWNLERFLKNPVILWAHDSSKLPIGKATALSVSDDGVITTRIQFSPKEANDFAETVWLNILFGTVRAASVGFNYGEVVEEWDGPKRVRRFLNNELLEISVVPVPADEDALVTGSVPVKVTKSKTVARSEEPPPVRDTIPAPPLEEEEPEEELSEEQCAAQEKYRKAASRAGRALANAKKFKSAVRADFLRLDAVEHTASGGLRIPARLSRTGVFTYVDAFTGRKRRELRLPEEVFAKKSLDTLRDVPVTLKHPPLGVVLPQTWRKDAVGHLSGAARQDGKFICGDVMIQDAAAVAGVETRKLSDISLGYRCDLEERAGVYEGEPYDCIQRNIIYNHVAVGPKGWGRAGTDVSLRLDGGAQLDSAFSEPDSAEVMKVTRIDGREYEIGSDAHLSKLEADQAKLAADHAAELAKVQGELTKAQARCDSLDVELKTTKEALAKATDPKTLEALVTEKSNFIASAKSVLGNDVRLDGKTDREIMISAVQVKDKAFTGEGKSDDYVRGRFEWLKEQGVRNDGVHNVVGRLNTEQRNDAAEISRSAPEEVPNWQRPVGVSKLSASH